MQTCVMGLFQKKPMAESSAPLYSVSLGETILIVGLGNPGQEYDSTRHNVGFACVDSFAESNDFPNWTNKKDLKAVVTQATLGSKRIILAKPTTFMNLSGEAIHAVQLFYKIPNSKTIVVHDELDISFGQIRINTDRGSAGHNGIESLIAHIGKDFSRIRVGINNQHKASAKDFVLKPFSKEENAEMTNLTREVSALLNEYVFASEQPLSETRSFID